MPTLWIDITLQVALLIWVFNVAAAQSVDPEVRQAAEAETRAESRESAQSRFTSEDSTGLPADSTGLPADSTGLPANLAALDWAQQARYAADNARLGPPAPDAPRVVFMGNSITEGWGRTYPSLFAAHPTWVNRGIGGQTSEQMLVRFRQDVIDLEPAAVVIAAGINDIAGNTGYASEDDTFGHIASMAELAHANGIRVVIASVLPAWDFGWRRGLAPAQKVVSLNGRLAAYAKTHGHVYLDGFALLADDRPGIKPGLHTDEVHLTAQGYAVLAPAVEAAVAKALHH